MEMKKFNYMLEIDILRNSSQKFLGVLRGAFSVFGCPKRHPDTLLAKTMIVAHGKLFCTPCVSGPSSVYNIHDVIMHWFLCTLKCIFVWHVSAYK